MLGASGRMGSEACRAVEGAADLELVASVGTTDALDELVSSKAEVAVDLTRPDAVMANVQFCVEHGISAVVGTSGFDNRRLDEVRSWLVGAPDVGVLVVPNFAIGAVLMMRFAELAAPYFDSVEVIELHHDAKVDAPSGTAAETTRRIAAASATWAPDLTETELFAGARGAVGPAGIHVHSVRLRGLVAHQEVLLGATGQTLTIRHDSFDRVSFMPGVVLACKRIAGHPGVTVGLEPLLGL